jgi:hypothetical protein
MGLQFFIPSSSHFLKICCILAVISMSRKYQVRKDKLNIWTKGILTNGTQHFIITSGSKGKVLPLQA